MAKAIHFKDGNRSYDTKTGARVRYKACDGVHALRAGPDVQMTEDLAAVTCKHCLKSYCFRAAKIEAERIAGITLPAELQTPVTDLETGKAWLAALVAAGLEFHLEDDPADIISLRTGRRIFSDSDVPYVRRAVRALYSFEWGEFDCPIGYVLHLTGHVIED